MDLRSNEPFWLVKNGLLHTYPSLRTDLECDILIIGGGITGSLIAHEMVEKGYNTVVVDKREIGYGSTSSTTSMLQYEIDVPLYRLQEMIGIPGANNSYLGCRDAIYKLRDLAQEIGSSCGFEEKKSVYFAAQKKDLKWLLHEFEVRKAAGLNVSWLEKDELKELYGLEALGAILSADGGSLDAFCMTHDLLHYNAKRGLRVFDKTAVRKVTRLKRGIIAQMDTGAMISAGKVIYCTGYEAQGLLPEKIVKLKSTYAMVSERNLQLKNSICDTLFWNTDSPYLYLRTTADGRLLVGGEDENFRNALRRDALLGRKEGKLSKTLKACLPGIDFITDFSWCGTFGETKDGLPYIGEHPRYQDTYFVLGFGGNGITFSVLGMEIISGLLEGKPNLLSHEFRFGR
ncbi:FAD-dependent oxidoreductase [Pedobacter antarcticus]|uniref:NAD(P)/FAD-dependent oxidoreductase n=1 Tax=Pedobacter antarcticus TaxID=34086 RepID=UPI002930E644|nr:FAD-dependent oxidoreductase [Pedobacter antarcticus]